MNVIFTLVNHVLQTRQVPVNVLIRFFCIVTLKTNVYKLRPNHVMLTEIKMFWKTRETPQTKSRKINVITTCSESRSSNTSSGVNTVSYSPIPKPNL